MVSIMVQFVDYTVVYTPSLCPILSTFDNPSQPPSVWTSFMHDILTIVLGLRSLDLYYRSSLMAYLKL